MKIHKIVNLLAWISLIIYTIYIAFLGLRDKSILATREDVITLVLFVTIMGILFLTAYILKVLDYKKLKKQK
jgi:hypothetical protein